MYTLIAMIMFASCGQTTTQENVVHNDTSLLNVQNTPMFTQANNVAPNNYKHAPSTTQNTPTQSKKKPVRLRDDATGMVMVTFPVPESWNPAQGQPDIQLEGPGGIKVYKEMTNTFYFSTDEATNAVNSLTVISLINLY
jgi:hypothetical protein